MRKKNFACLECGSETKQISGPRKMYKSGKITCWRICKNCGTKVRVELNQYGQIIGEYKKPKKPGEKLKLILKQKPQPKPGETIFIHLEEDDQVSMSYDSMYEKIQDMINS